MLRKNATIFTDGSTQGWCFLLGIPRFWEPGPKQAASLTSIVFELREVMIAIDNTTIVSAFISTREDMILRPTSSTCSSGSIPVLHSQDIVHVVLCATYTGLPQCYRRPSF